VHVVQPPSGRARTRCEDRAIDRYCEGKWNRRASRSAST
jgi:hypothetical protein